MRPGSSDTWLKAIFFAGLWVIATHLVLGGIAWLIPRSGGDAEGIAFFVTAIVLGLSPLWVIAVVILICRVHQSGRVPAAYVGALTVESVFVVLYLVTQVA